ncbi:MAG TPA: VCBS repeat-containing protein, partial [Terriglobales bacterium]|nr:VCBS repeat-containing protein [Terriglobales bacterium]
MGPAGTELAALSIGLWLLVAGSSLAQNSARRAAANGISTRPPVVNFVDFAAQAGLRVKTEAGGEKAKKYIIETTGSGAAFFDFDNDGWPDIFMPNGSRLDGFPADQEPTSHLYRNQHNGTFVDVTQSAGAALKGWGQGVCAGDYNNDGRVDLFVTFWGHNVLLRNNGDGTFSDVTKKAGLWRDDVAWSTGCAFLDYDRDGKLDLFIAHYVDLDLA